MEPSTNVLITEIKQEVDIDIKEEDEIEISDIVIKEEICDYDPLMDCTGLSVEDAFKLAPYADAYVFRKSGDRIKRLRQKICPICKRQFVVSYFRIHLQTHEQFKDEKQPAKKVECTECKLMVTPQAYPGHKRLHTGERPFVCATCGLTFVKLCTMRSHEAIHKGERPFKCPCCKKSFSRKTYLTLHIRTHTGEKLYECDECGKLFTFRPSLMLHLRVHADDKRYICQICNKRCITKENLKCHMVTHTKERKYECAACGDRFAQSGHMKTHVTMYCKGEPKHPPKESKKEEES